MVVDGVGVVGGGMGWMERWGGGEMGRGWGGFGGSVWCCVVMGCVWSLGPFGLRGQVERLGRMAWCALMGFVHELSGFVRPIDGADSSRGYLQSGM